MAWPIYRWKIPRPGGKQVRRSCRAAKSSELADVSMQMLTMTQGYCMAWPIYRCRWKIPGPCGKRVGRSCRAADVSKQGPPKLRDEKPDVEQHDFELSC